MRAQIGDRTATILGVEAPVQKLLCVIVAVLSERGTIQVHRLWHFVGRACRDTAIPLAIQVRHTTQQLAAVEDVVAHVVVAGVAMALMADLQDATRLTLGFHHVARGVDGVSHHLLAVHHLARLQSKAGIGGVQEVGRGDQHAVQVLLLGQHLLNVGVFVAGAVGILDAAGDLHALE